MTKDIMLEYYLCLRPTARPINTGSDCQSSMKKFGVYSSLLFLLSYSSFLKKHKIHYQPLYQTLLATNTVLMLNIKSVSFFLIKNPNKP